MEKELPEGLEWWSQPQVAIQIIVTRVLRKVELDQEDLFNTEKFPEV
jgi:hypothetical protein